MAHSQNTISFMKANEKYVEQFPPAQGDLGRPPTKNIAIVTCMDCRLNPFGHLGLSPGEAHVIRTAGGNAREALRSLIISQRELKVKEIAVFHHTDCAHPGDIAVSTALEAINFKPMGTIDGSVQADVKFWREHPLILYKESITGWEYNVKTGAVTTRK